MKNRRSFLTTGILSTVVCAIIVCTTQFIPAWGVWYSVEDSYLLQLDSLLKGQLALTPNIAASVVDWAWGTAFHQIWGLGTPLLLLPFEALYRLFGAPFSPINLVYLIYLFATVTFVVYAIKKGPLRQLGFGQQTGAAALIAAVVFLNGGHLSLLTSHFSVYHQAIAFGFIAAIALLFLTLRIYDSPSPAWLYGLAFWAGFVVNVRATLAAAGAASALIALPRWWRATAIQKLLCVLLFAAGPAFLLTTNWLRFWSPFEFGHLLCLSGDTSGFHQMRFDAAMKYATWTQAAGELFGMLFTKSTDPFTGEHLLAPFFRNRTLKFWPFNIFDLVLVLWALAYLGLYVAKRKIRLAGETSRAAVILTAWSLFVFVSLFAFYSRNHSIFSRYLADFSATIAALEVALVLYALGEKPSATRWQAVLFVGFVVIGTQFTFLRLPELKQIRHDEFPGAQRNANTQAELAGRHERSLERINKNADYKIPDHYACPDPTFKRDIIDSNLVGWEVTQLCHVNLATQLFLPQAPCYQFTYDQSELPPIGQALILPRVRVGLEEYKMQTERVEGERITRRYCTAGNFRWHPTEGKPQLVTIAWIPPTSITPELTKYFLKVKMYQMGAVKMENLAE